MEIHRESGGISEKRWHNNILASPGPVNGVNNPWPGSQCPGRLCTIIFGDIHSEYSHSASELVQPYPFFNPSNDTGASRFTAARERCLVHPDPVFFWDGSMVCINSEKKPFSTIPVSDRHPLPVPGKTWQEPFLTRERCNDRHRAPSYGAGEGILPSPGDGGVKG